MTALQTEAHAQQFSTSAFNRQPAYAFHTVFISDVHFGSGTTSAAYLYEFMSNLDVTKLKKLYLVGDIIDGWLLGTEKQKTFPEMERRCIDLINHFDSLGIETVYVPGNHDERLRALIERLNAQREKARTFMPVHMRFALEDIWETGGADNLRFEVEHGDSRDPSWFTKPLVRPFVMAISSGYDALIRFNHRAASALYDRFGIHLKIASFLKQNFKKTISFIFAQDSLLGGLKKNGHDGIISGHTHTAGRHEHVHEDGRVSYLINDGDWVESCTFAATRAAGDIPEIYEYKTLREELGFGDLPDTDDQHPFAAQRRQTDRQIRAIHRLWPSATRKKHVEKLFHARRKYADHLEDRAFLTGVWEELRANGRVGADERRTLTEIFGETNKDAYKSQRKKVAEIFGRVVPGQIIEGNDRLVVQNVVRQFITRADKKLSKHRETMNKAAKALDMHSKARGLKKYKPSQGPLPPEFG